MSKATAQPSAQQAPSAKSRSTVRVPTCTIIVHRNGNREIPVIGQPFEFTQGEIDEVDAMQPGALAKQVTMQVDDLPKAEKTVDNNDI